jgi:N-acyl-D-aspartate/D-glutamate deacylase
MAHDLVIRGGKIVDGSGTTMFDGDVAIDAGVIVAVGTVPGCGREEIDATGCIVTPGFVDIHTHYDGQVMWENRLSPSSGHGVTTVVMGNCGVGFAPCRADHRAMLVEVMEGVEDIPEVVMTGRLSPIISMRWTNVRQMLILQRRSRTRRSGSMSWVAGAQRASPQLLMTSQR